MSYSAKGGHGYGGRSSHRAQVRRHSQKANSAFADYQKHSRLAFEADKRGDAKAVEKHIAQASASLEKAGVESAKAKRSEGKVFINGKWL